MSDLFHDDHSGYYSACTHIDMPRVFNIRVSGNINSMVNKK